MKTHIFSYSLFFLLFLAACQNNKNNQQTVENLMPTDSIYAYVDDAARFPGCEDQADKKICSEEKLLKYIYDSIKYPVYAIDHQIQGRCILSAVVEKDGSLSNLKILKDIGGGCGEAALRSAQSMQSNGVKWIPGKLHGKIVRSTVVIPVNFKIKLVQDSITR